MDDPIKAKSTSEFPEDLLRRSACHERKLTITLTSIGSSALALRPPRKHTDEPHPDFLA
jgi:hypothetical protein